MFLYFVHKLFSFIYLFFFSSITFLWFNLLILIFVVKFCNSSTAKCIYLLFISLYPNFPYFFVQSFSIRACHSNLSHTIGWSFAFIMKVMDLKPRHVFSLVATAIRPCLVIRRFHTRKKTCLRHVMTTSVSRIFMRSLVSKVVQERFSREL